MSLTNAGKFWTEALAVTKIITGRRSSILLSYVLPFDALRQSTFTELNTFCMLSNISRGEVELLIILSICMEGW